MKLRNKKTGEIMQLSVKCENGGELRTFDLNTNTDKPITLAELNAEWEDYHEEPKDYWYIECDGEVYSTDRLIGYDSNKLKAICNYFETPEEAEKAVEKLKAWKRLKDKGFKITGWGFRDDEVGIFIRANCPSNTVDELELLFGGEE